MVDSRDLTRDFFRIITEAHSHLESRTHNSPTKTIINEDVAMGSHILNLYEAHSEPLSLIYDIINAALQGKLEEVQEKLDGQNVSFSWIDGGLQIFSKGVNWSRMQKAISGEKPGHDAETIASTYGSRPAIKDSFLDAFKILNNILRRDPDLTERLFQNGKVSVTSLLMHPKNPNTILYDDPTLKFVEVVGLDPEIEVDGSAYKQFVSLAEQEQDDNISAGMVPILKFAENSDAKEQVAELENELDALIDRANLTRSNTVGELIYKLVLYHLEDYSFIPEHLRDAAARRLVFGDKKGLTRGSFQQKENWEKFQQIEKDKIIIMRAIAPLEQVIQKLGTYVFRTLKFVLGSDDLEGGKELQTMANNVSSAFQQGRIIADPMQMRRIEAALERAIPQLEMFEKQIEGIVFNYNGKWFKLTGLFTALNKLRGYFAFGNNPAQIKD